MKPAKVLIISHNPCSKSSNNGKTLESIFSTFDRDNLAQMFFVEDKNIDLGFCKTYYKITDIDNVKNILGFTTSYGDKINLQRKEEYSQVESSVEQRFLKVVKRHFFHLGVLRDMIWKAGKWNTQRLFQWIDDFNPTMIFFVAGSQGFAHEISMNISKRYNIPLFVYFTDDYLINPICRNIFERIQKNRIKTFYRKTVNHSIMCFAIGDLMCQEYSHYFGRIFVPIMNSVELKKNLIPYRSTKPINISYFGGLHLGRWKVICQLAEVVKTCNAKLGWATQINVFTGTKVTEEILTSFKESNVNLHLPLFGDDLQEAMGQADIFLHVESNNKFDRSLTKLSVSTKIPEYLISRRPIIGYGPPELASIRLLADNNIGFTLSPDIDESTASGLLCDFFTNEQYRLKLTDDGYDFAINNFDKTKTSKSFKNKIESVLNKSV